MGLDFEYHLVGPQQRSKKKRAAQISKPLLHRLDLGRSGILSVLSRFVHRYWIPLGKRAFISNDAGHCKSFFFALSLCSSTLVCRRTNRVCCHRFRSFVSP